MEDNKYKQLQKDVNRLNEEGFIPDGQELRVFRNAEELIGAIRRNEVSNITWTEEDEAKWQAAEAIEKAFEVHDNEPKWKSGTVEEFFDDTVVDWAEEQWEEWSNTWPDIDEDITLIG